MIKKEEFIVYDGDPIKFIGQWLANRSCEISEELGYKVKKFKIIVSIENIKN